MIGTTSAAARSTVMLFENSNLRLKRCRHGVMMFCTNDSYIGRSLGLYGEFSEREIDHRVGDSCLDRWAPPARRQRVPESQRTSKDQLASRSLPSLRATTPASLGCRNVASRCACSSVVVIRSASPDGTEHLRRVGAAVRKGARSKSRGMQKGSFRPVRRVVPSRNIFPG